VARIAGVISQGDVTKALATWLAASRDEAGARVATSSVMSFFRLAVKSEALVNGHSIMNMVDSPSARRSAGE
jgi:hypothetical protein